jgi:hypothetical protein
METFWCRDECGKKKTIKTFWCRDEEWAAGNLERHWNI